MAIRRVLVVLAALLMMAASVDLAQAQGRGGRGGRGGGFGQFSGGFGGGGVSAMALVRRSDVQKELDLTDDQISDIDEIAQAARENRGGFGGFDFGALRDGSPEERAEALAKFRELRRERTEEQDKKVQELLSKTQQSRLAELTFQMALERGQSEAAATAAGVKLSDEDREKLEKARDEIMAKVDEQIAKLRREANLEVLETVMSSNQIDRAGGEAFTFEQQERRQFGAGRGTGGRGGGGGRRNARPARPSGEDDANEEENAGGRRRRR